MMLSELSFREYYHRYVVLEADALTELLKANICISEHDCFVLCSGYIGKNGILSFNVLAVGEDWDSCTKGLENPAMLGTYAPEQVGNLTAKKCSPCRAAREKNEKWIRRYEELTDHKLLETRAENRIDELRNVYYPDIVKAGIMTMKGIREYDMRIRNFNGPFLEGILIEDTPLKNYRKGDLMRTLPYKAGSGCRLLVVFSGELSAKDEQSLDNLIRQGNAKGFGFSQNNGFRN